VGGCVALALFSLAPWGVSTREERDDRLLPLVYAELRKRARHHLRRERHGHTVMPTDLVHETCLRLVAQNPAWQNRERSSAGSSAA
jgi:DNA-directed RNA polymerase specialized sigma24 family protein